MKQTTLYLDDETLNRINARKGQLNRRILELINIGLQFENSKSDDEHIIYDLARTVGRLRKLSEEGRLVLITPTKLK